MPSEDCYVGWLIVIIGKSCYILYAIYEVNDEAVYITFNKLFTVASEAVEQLEGTTFCFTISTND